MTTRRTTSEAHCPIVHERSVARQLAARAAWQQERDADVDRKDAA